VKKHSWDLKDFYSWSDVKIASLVYIVAKVYFLIFLSKDIPPGDATEGLYQIIQLDLYHRAPFVAYHFLGILFTQGLSKIGISYIIALNIMSSFFGAIGASFTYKFAKHFLGNTKNALLATSFTVFSGTYWFFSEIGDSYIVHTAFLIISLVMFLEKKFVFSGITYGVALLVYPEVGLVAPFYPIIAYYYGYSFTNFLKTVASAAIIYLPPVFILFEEYFWGRMGILVAIMVNSVAAKTSQDILHLLKGIYHLIRSLHIALPFMILGLYICLRRNRLFAFLTLVLVPIHLYINITNPEPLASYSLSIYPFFGILRAVGLTTLLNSGIFHKHHFKALCTFVLVYLSLSFVLLVGPMKQFIHSFRDFAESFHSKQTRDYRVVSDFYVYINYNFYTSSTLYSGKCLYFKNLTDTMVKSLFSKGIPIYLVVPRGVRNPLKMALINLFPSKYVNHVRTKTFYETLLKNRLDYKLKLIKTAPFYVYELYP